MICTTALALPLAGCLLGSERPDPALDIPPAYRGAPRNAEAALPTLDWWRGFRSRELTTIIEEVRAANLDIAAAIARIIQADAQARVTGAALLPAFSGGYSATHTRSSLNTGTSTSSSSGSSSDGASGSSRTNTAPSRERTLHQTSITASYEIDFWGKNLSAQRAAEETAVASRYDREVVGLAQVVAAANAYFQVLAAQDRLRVARENLVSSRRVLTLIEQRVTAGTASSLETAQQESLVNTVRAAIPPLEQTLRQNQNALAVLMARSPESIRIRGGTLRSIRVPRVTPGLPSELLTQRPDIREAEAQLAAANANVENARAQFLPSIQLTGEGGYQSAVLKTLIQPESAFYSAVGSLTQPIFQGGRLFGNLDLQTGRQDELLQNYRKAVISGFADVENALVAVQQTALRENLQREVVTSSRQAFDISEERLRGGTVDLVTVLNTQQTLFQAEDALAQARLDRLMAVVGLYRALGGGWLPKPDDTPLEQADAR